VTTVTITKIDEAYVRLDCDLGTLQEISDAFTFKVPGAEFMPAYKSRFWDGKIRLVNTVTRAIYAGLYSHIRKFCESRDYDVVDGSDFSQQEFSAKEAHNFAMSLGLPEKVEPRDYQLRAFIHAVRNKRCMLLSPTASGKSLIIYLITRYYNAKTLIVVPTVSLVHQLAGDFESYGYSAGDDGSGGIHKIFSGQEREAEAQVTITTWQSVYKQRKEWFQKFDVVIGDEAHLFKAKSLNTIMTNLNRTQYRFGLTGTLDGTQTHQLVLEGLFGPVYKVITTSELMEQKHVSDLKIKCLVLGYPDTDRKLVKDMDYQAEMDFIVTNPARNRFIKNLAISLEGNTLILFQFVEKHGKVLYDLLKDEDRRVFFVHGGVDGDEREEIRHIVAKENDAIIVASYGTFSTGINIPSISNLVFASPSKSKIRNLQSIGRGLRKADGKSVATLYDISDDLTWKAKRNHTINHFMERVKIYNEENFEYKLYNVKLNQ
jgi:superfamily II DNA or RNA helicase